MKKEKNIKHPKLHKIWLLAGWSTPILLSILLAFLFPHMPTICEYGFARGISKFFNSTLGFLISFIPISLTECLLYLAVLSVIFLVLSLLVALIKYIIDKIRHKEPKELTEEEEQKEKEEFYKGLRGCGWFISCMILFYTLVYGGNSYRYTASQLCNFEQQKYSVDQLYSLCCDLADHASIVREKCKEDSNGLMIFETSEKDILKHAGDGYPTLEKDYPFLSSPVRRAKPVLSSHLWSYTGYEGVYFPLFMESNVNIDIPDYAIPAAAAHELAHLRGFAKEDEAGFFGCLSCFNHPSAEYQYSGYMTAYLYCSNQLYYVDEELGKKARAHLSKGALRDLNSYGDYWDQFEGSFQDFTLDVNDTMIKLRGVKDGSLSYDRMILLLLASYTKGTLFPI